MKQLLRVDHLTKAFDDNGPVVDSVTFEVRENEIFALLGPSGCGKTTCLRLISGFERADEGEVYVEEELLESPDRHVAPQDRGIGFVFQDYALFPHLSVIDNVAFGLTDIPKHKRHVYAEEVLCRTGMGDYKDRNPSELSGGQQQRVALARAIAPKPKLVLLDEPFSNLDAVLRESTRKEVRSILKKAGMSALLVTHDQEEALSFADRIAVMNDGRIEQVGTPEEVYYKPKTKFVAQFLGRTNLFRVEAAGEEEVMTELGKLHLNCCARGRVLCSIRPEHLTLEKPNGAELDSGVGTVVNREFKGHDITYHVMLNGERYLVHTDNRLLFDPEDKVVIKPLESAVVLQEDQ
ncbi:ABC transporter ATP-binding protein [Halalkalibaculum sp. DA3122]|uniref:ABC transporter ATP-binding protein n=1 Tax=Halalkalibaculum sp. DA3122 TaxID=3373607 RepID=UPI0037548D43